MQDTLWFGNLGHPIKIFLAVLFAITLVILAVTKALSLKDFKGKFIRRKQK